MITIFGLGFVGITTALYFCHRNKKVFGIDIDKNKIDMISNAILPFYEPKLQEELKNEINKHFFISKNKIKNMNESDFIYVCVDTNMLEDNHADLSSINTVINEILDNIDLSTYKTIVIKSSNSVFCKVLSSSIIYS